MNAAARPGGFFITFEGPEGSGKSTQAETLAGSLRIHGLKVFVTREPGGTALGEAIREILLGRHDLGISPWAEALLFTAARTQHVEEIIRPRLAEVDIVICDRYSDSTMAYQGYGRQLDRATLARLQEVATGGLKPDLTILLNLPVEVGLGRISRERRDRLDDETIKFHTSVHDGYLELAAGESTRWREIDAASDAKQVASSVLQRVREALITAGRWPAERQSA